MFKFRPCLIHREVMPLPHNDILRHRVERDISLSFLFTTGAQNQDFLTLYIHGFTTAAEITAPLSLKDLEENI